MFWRFGFHTQSAIDTLLDKEEVTLEEVLEEEELIQECKSHNRKLVDFICRPEVLDALLTYIIEKPADDLDEGVKYKYPCLSAEIFGCEVLAICDALIRNDNLLREFWKFLDQPAPLNPIQASYFSRVFAVLLQKKTGETVQFFKDQEGCLDKLLTHIGTSAVMDLTLKLLTAEETKEGGGVLQWLLDNGLVLKLTDKLDPTLSKETHANASQLLIDIMAVAQNFGTRNPVLEQLKSGPVATKLLDHLVKADSPNIHSAIAGGFGVFIELIQRSLGFVHDGEPADIDFKEEDLTELMAALEPRLGKFHEIMLEAKPAGVSQPISESTPEKPLPLGSVRLKIIELFVIILHSNSSLINKKILELNVIPSYIDLFFKYQWNNFLHSLVHDMIVKIFSFDLQHVDDLMINVLKDGRLTEKIVEAAKQNEADVEERKGVRRGYMGHLILISNHLVKYAELPDVSDEIKSYFQAENWKDFEKLILAETNQRDSKPLGGHRPVLTNPDNDDVLHPALNDGDTSADQFARFLCHQITADLPEKFGEEEDDDFDMDDEVIEKPNFEAAGAYSNDHYLRSAIEFDDSDDEPESPQNDNWANFNSAFESKSKFDEDDQESQRNPEGH